MKYLLIPNSDLLVSNIALGFWRLAGKSAADAKKLVETAVGEGINFFDNADVYGRGEVEEIFGSVLRADPALRRNILVQTKCGIVPDPNGTYYDFSKKHIVESVEGSLKRLGIETIDVLLLHRPDILMDPDTVARAFSDLYESGKVRHFGVSNFNGGQIALLKKHVKAPILFNQLQLSIVHCPMIDEGVNVNMMTEEAQSRGTDVLDFCRLNDITIQAWSIVQGYGREGTFLNNPKYPELNDALTRIAKIYGLTENALAVAWLLRHPAKFQPISGSTNPEHVKELCKASEVKISREHFYEIYRASGKVLP